LVVLVDVVVVVDVVVLARVVLVVVLVGTVLAVVHMPSLSHASQQLGNAEQTFPVAHFASLCAMEHWTPPLWRRSQQTTAPGRPQMDLREQARTSRAQERERMPSWTRALATAPAQRR